MTKTTDQATSLARDYIGHDFGRCVRVLRDLDEGLDEGLLAFSAASEWTVSDDMKCSTFVSESRTR